MDSVNIFLMNLKGKIPNEALLPLKNSLEKAGENAVQKLVFLNLKSPVVGLVLSLLFGILGVDRFYKGDLKLGLTKLGLLLAGFALLVGSAVLGAMSETVNVELMSDDDIAQMVIDEYFLPFVVGLIGILACYVWWIVDIFLVFFGIKKDNLARIHRALH